MLWWKIISVFEYCLDLVKNFASWLICSLYWIKVQGHCVHPLHRVCSCLHFFSVYQGCRFSVIFHFFCYFWPDPFSYFIFLFLNFLSLFVFIFCETARTRRFSVIFAKVQWHPWFKEKTYMGLLNFLNFRFQFYKFWFCFLTSLPCPSPTHRSIISIILANKEFAVTVLNRPMTLNGYRSAKWLGHIACCMEMRW